MDLPYKQSSSVHSSLKNDLYSRVVCNALLSIFDQFLNKISNLGRMCVTAGREYIIEQGETVPYAAELFEELTDPTESFSISLTVFQRGTKELHSGALLIRPGSIMEIESF